MNDPPQSTVVAGLPPESLRRALYHAVDEAFEREQVPLLRRLVEQPSFTTARADVEAAAGLVDEAAAAVGLVAERWPDPNGVYADHRIYRSAATGPDDPSIALVGHVDTVFPRSLGFVAFARDDGPEGPDTGDIVRGPGVLDMKSGLTVILCAIAALRRATPDAAGRLRVRFVCNTDEEVGSPSSEPMLHALAPKLTAALVFEAGRDADRIVTMRKGGGMFELVVHGRAAHAGNAHAQGINAIHALALLVPRIEAITDYARGITVNVGVIEGGTSKNTVPERASCLVDTRFDTGADAQHVIAALQAIARQPFAPRDWVPQKLRAVRAELIGGVTRPPMESGPGTARLRARYEACAADVGLAIGEAPRQGGGSDGNLLAAWGVPTIDGLGPWGKDFHQTTEHSSLASLRRRTQALACLLAQELAPR
jgi:glutamate carboxypeptidase